MATATAAALGLAAGLHGALYGAYKDSPHESFLLRRFLREIDIALTVVLGLTWVLGAHDQSMFVLYLSTFALTRDGRRVQGRLDRRLFLEEVHQEQYFVVPCAVTWLIYMALCSHSDW